MKATRSYALRIEPHPDEDGYLAYFPALPGCHTWGETYEAAVNNAEQALAVYVETLAAHGDPLPDEAALEKPISLGVMVRSPIDA